MPTTKHLRAAIDEHETAKQERDAILFQTAELERELRLAEDWAKGANDAHIDTAGKHRLGEADYDALAAAEHNRANADKFVLENRAALKLLKARLPQAEAKVVSARAGANNTALTLASPLVATCKARIERLARELADEIHRAARLVAFDGGFPHAQRLVSLTGDPAKVMRDRGIPLEVGFAFDHQLQDGRDNMTADELLTLLEDAAAQ